MIYIGIDPGVSGGIAGIDHTGAFSFAHKWGETDERSVEVFSDAILECGVPTLTHCAIERVWASPQMGVVSAMTFGGAYHLARGLAMYVGFKLIEPTPQQWQKAMNCLTRGDKTITKRLATEMFPNVKVTNATADALLLAAYCRRVALGEIQGPTNNGKESSRKKKRQ